jgi:hypothetical protein
MRKGCPAPRCDTRPRSRPAPATARRGRGHPNTPARRTCCIIFPERGELRKRLDFSRTGASATPFGPSTGMPEMQKPTCAICTGGIRVPGWQTRCEGGADIRSSQSAEAGFVTFQPQFQPPGEKVGGIVRVADAPGRGTPHIAGPPSPRRRTLRFSSGEFIRSRRRTARCRFTFAMGIIRPGRSRRRASRPPIGAPPYIYRIDPSPPPATARAGRRSRCRCPAPASGARA